MREGKVTIMNSTRLDAILRYALVGILAAALAACGSGRAVHQLGEPASNLRVVSVQFDSPQGIADFSRSYARPVIFQVDQNLAPDAAIEASTFREDRSSASITLTLHFADSASTLASYLALPEGLSLGYVECTPEPLVMLAHGFEPGIIALGIAAGKAGILSVEIELTRNTSASKSALAVPTDPANAVVLSATDSGGDAQLSWSELNIGDYDMNSRVAIADITPLAMFFGHTESGTWDPWHDAVNGNGDDTINIADITPIAVHFGKTVVGYRVMRHPDGVGDWTQVTEVPRPYDPSAAGQPKERPPYEYTDTSAPAAAFYAVQPSDGELSFGVSSNVAPFGSPAAAPPSPPPVETVEPGPEEIVLAVGETALLEDIDLETTRSLATGSGQEYLLVLTCESEVQEGYDPEEFFEVELDYTGSATVSSASSAAPLMNRPWSPVASGGTSSLDLQSQIEAVLAADGSDAPRVKRTAAVDDTHDFTIVFIDADLTTVDGSITARCTNVGTSCVLWVDTRVDDGRITPAQLDGLEQWLDNRIVTQEIDTYGDITDPDEDGRIAVIFTPAINQMVGLVGGMFVANDLQPTAVGSNSMDSVYIQVPDPGGEYEAAGAVSPEAFADSLVSTPAHELQHLINFSNRLRSYQAGHDFVFEEYWLNEALSHFTEDFSGFQPGNNFSMSNYFVTGCPWTALPGGNSWSPDIFRRGAGYLYMRYLVDRFGEGILSELLQKDKLEGLLGGWANAETATGESMERTLLRWGVAMYASGLGVSTSTSCSYDPVANDSETGAPHGVHFRSGNTSYNGDLLPVSEPLAYMLTPDGIASAALTARKNGLLFVRLLPGANAYGRLTITPLNGDTLQAAVLRTDTGEVILEDDAENLYDGGVVLGSLSAPGETDTYLINAPAPHHFVIRVVSLSAVLDEFSFSVNDSLKPNHAIDPSNPSGPPPGVYQLLSNFTTSGMYELKVSSAVGATGNYYLMVIPF